MRGKEGQVRNKMKYEKYRIATKNEGKVYLRDALTSARNVYGSLHSK
jgi:hypothetical protein